MKPLPLILLNAAVTCGVLFAYDQIRGDPTLAPTRDAAPATDTASLEARIAELESKQRPMLEAALSPELLARFREIDARIENQLPNEDAAKFERMATPEVRPGMIIENEDEISPEALAEFKKIIHEVKRDERTKRIRKRTDKALASLELDLDEASRQKLAEAYADFEQRRNEVWAEVKQEAAEGAGDSDWAVIISDTQARLAGEFRQRIVEFVPDRDAGDVATALFPASGSK